ncbi:MAG TPA: universal stress protein [Smithella sp.]|nr:universal stress protein [Smithella sp.]MDM7987952.1 universal stress protein [Smithella sp.]HNY50637.1 universal stress protein [Smithella sp.]HOG89204.1 universal stress protein [Smithella sp.]HOU49956.1 universal stress protein [Smithella sp.]
MLNFKNILYPIDLDSQKITSLEKALEVAQFFNCPIHILYVNDIEAGYRHPTDREDAVALRVKELIPESLLEGLKIIYAVSKGDTAEEILQYAYGNNIDLIVIGHKNRGKLYAALFDSTDVNIIDQVSLPVLVVPEQ